MRYARALGYARALRYLLPHCSDTIEILRPRCAASCTRLTRNTHTDTQQETRDTVRKREEKQGNTRKHEVQYRRARADAQGYRGRVVKTYSSKDIHKTRQWQQEADIDGMFPERVVRIRINVELFSVVRRNPFLRATLGSRLRWERLYVSHWCFFFWLHTKQYICNRMIMMI